MTVQSRFFMSMDDRPYEDPLYIPALSFNTSSFVNYVPHTTTSQISVPRTSATRSEQDSSISSVSIRSTERSPSVLQ
jgi:hypothetical protein